VNWLADRRCQVGYIFQRLTFAGLAFGEVLAVLYPPLFWVGADFFILVGKSLQIVFELLFGLVFYNLYPNTPEQQQNPFAFAVPYCNDTTQAPYQNYLVGYNQSGAFALVFGCNTTEEVASLVHRTA
jgi:hypothetical protein